MIHHFIMNPKIFFRSEVLGYSYAALLSWLENTHRNDEKQYYHPRKNNALMEKTCLRVQ